ncbi:MAG: hypothetical protein FWH41_10350 [Treponema sp.]|nr:hypothetical protein [Treponema sp.]MCL2139912.1 hypothetical protein [Treponema sp.]
MAYEKTVWKARQGENLNRFDKENETSKSVVLRNNPSLLTEPGTPFSAANMNRIEQGIADAHEAIEAHAVLLQNTVAEKYLHNIMLSTYPSPPQVSIFISIYNGRSAPYTGYDVQEIMEFLRDKIPQGRYFPAIRKISPMGPTEIESVVILSTTEKFYLYSKNTSIGNGPFWDFINPENNMYSFYPDEFCDIVM